MSRLLYWYLERAGRVGVGWGASVLLPAPGQEPRTLSLASRTAPPCS